MLLMFLEDLTHMHASNVIPQRLLKKRVFVFCLLPLISLFGLIRSADAHRVTVFGWKDGDTVYTESKFSGGKKVTYGDIIVYDFEGNELVRGKTNVQGEFSFKANGKKGIKIVLNAGMGHRAEWEIPPDRTQDKVKPVALGGAHYQQLNNEIQRKVVAKPTEDVLVAPEELQRLIEKTLDRKLAPLMKMLAGAVDREPDARDILGGIGYILGLMGIGAYFKYRHKLKQDRRDQ
jgi:nickel transport protein